MFAIHLSNGFSIGIKGQNVSLKDKSSNSSTRSVTTENSDKLSFTFKRDFQNNIAICISPSLKTTHLFYYLEGI